MEQLYKNSHRVLEVFTMVNEVQKAKPSQTYKFKVRNQTFEWPSRTITGREVLTAAGLLPPENYKLDLKTHGNNYREIKLDQVVDLGEPGIEKFTYISRDQTEG